MSLNNEQRIGFVFFLKESSKVSESFTKTRFCSNEKCKNHFKDFITSKFCSECGTQIEEKQIPNELKYPDIYDFITEYLNNREIVVSDNGGLPENIWLYNFQVPEDCYVGVENIGSNKDFTNFNIKESLKRFESLDKVDAFLKMFKAVYGEDSVEVRFMSYETWY